MKWIIVKKIKKSSKVFVTLYYTGYCLTGDSSIRFEFSSKRDAEAMVKHLQLEAGDIFTDVVVDIAKSIKPVH